MLHNNSGSFFQKKKSVTWIKLISDILERINRFQVSFDTDDGHCVWSRLLKKNYNLVFCARKQKFFSLYIFWSRHHLATPTHPPCHQTSSFGQPTHPPLWWRNTWMPPNDPHALYIYLVNVQTMGKIFFQIWCAFQKVRTLNRQILMSGYQLKWG